MVGQRLSSSKAESEAEVYIKGSHKGRAAWLASVDDWWSIFECDPAERVELVRAGVPATDAKKMFQQLEVPQARLLSGLRISQATLNRKAKSAENLSPEDSERVVGMSKIIGLAQSLVEQSGSPKGFDVASWVANWLQTPVPALDGRCPVDYMDTMEGQGIVSSLLERMQSGAYG